MSPYKNFLNAAKAYLNSVPFLKFLLSSYIYVFGLGGLLYLLGAFFGYGVSNFMSPIGIILMYAGLVLTIVQEDVITLLITSGVISIGSLIAWIVALAGTAYGFSVYGYNYGFSIGGGFSFGPFLYFLIFGAIAVLVLVKSEKLKQMRAEAQARAQVQAQAQAQAQAQMRTQAAGTACPRCGAFIPVTAGFCPSCGAPKPVQQYAPPTQPQYTPPVQPQPAPPVQPQPAPPVQPQPAPPVQPRPAPPVQPQPAPPVQPRPAPPVQPQPAPPIQPVTVSSEENTQAASTKCIVCGEELPLDAKFCGKCGSKQ
ncbi:MAG: hypothetical protein PHO15_01320 [Eubacteriales bacterium]|nr:hypothetical protein [Eubacteriales bacterium]